MTLAFELAEQPVVNLLGGVWNASKEGAIGGGDHSHSISWKASFHCDRSYVMTFQPESVTVNQVWQTHSPRELKMVKGNHSNR